ncbi:hypothetical protein BDN70DRAFT_895072 [Pholiota conissans]|uniref:Uncharacterized protein n=1 Tax=Pholiota conissans TaxID=109636 RepID=A0A9P5Z194_9AGAR|nr:hypothetical protein BDN70DRAFT_895072 [Pholiota conissans]
MVPSLFTFSLLFLCVGCALAVDITIIPPLVLISGSPAVLAWVGGTPPYSAQVFTSGLLGLPILIDTIATASLLPAAEWTVSVPDGVTSVFFVVEDAVLDIAQTDSIPIQSGLGLPLAK